MRISESSGRSRATVWNMAASLVYGSSVAHIARADSSMIAQPVRSPPTNIAKADRTTRCADTDIFREFTYISHAASEEELETRDAIAWPQGLVRRPQRNPTGRMSSRNAAHDGALPVPLESHARRDPPPGEAQSQSPLRSGRRAGATYPLKSFADASRRGISGSRGRGAELFP